MGMMDRENLRMVRKLVVVTIGMFAFGYALIPIYKHICELTGINILSLTEGQIPGNGKTGGAGITRQLPGGQEPHHHGRIRRQCPWAVGFQARPEFH